MVGYIKTITQQQDSTIMFPQDFLTLCIDANTILITGPQSLDGDSIGAALALREMILQKTSSVVHIAGIPTHQYLHLSGIDDWKPNTDLHDHYDVAIVVDGDRYRLESTVETSFNKSKQTILIDHHKSTETESYNMAWLNPTAVSTCSMIYELHQEWHCTLTPTIAESLYVGLLFDTGGFQHSNTNADTMRLAAILMEQGFDANTTYIKVVKEKRPQGWKLQSAMFQNSTLLYNGRIHIAWVSVETMNTLGCDNGDIEGLVNDLRCTTGVDFAALIVGLSNGTHKVSLRSNPTFGDKEGIDCSALAKSLSVRGGGHTRASGARLDMNLQDSIEHVKTMSLQFAQQSKPL